MRFQSLFPATATVALFLSFGAATAHDAVHINDAYARFLPGAKSGAAFFEVENHQTADDVLLGVASPIADKVELHTHIHGDDGVMQMRPIEGGIVIPAQASAWLQRGGDHVMFMGLTTIPKDGETFPLTLTFERAGEVTVDVTVDNTREPGEMMPMNTHTGGEAHGAADHSGHTGHDMTSHQGQMSHAGHDGHGMGASVDQSGMTDAEAIAAVMKAQFDRPEAPLTVDPIVVQGRSAIASWAQDGKGGRALLAKGDQGWQITLCGGADLLDASFLDKHGVKGADTLAALFKDTEAKLGDDKVALSSSFEGVVMITPME